MIRMALSLVLALLAMGGVAQAIAVDGPIVITSPGIYEITGDIAGAGQNAAIEIATSDVVLEGGGHAWQGLGPGRSRASWSRTPRARRPPTS